MERIAVIGNMLKSFCYNSQGLPLHEQGLHLRSNVNKLLELKQTAWNECIGT